MYSRSTALSDSAYGGSAEPVVQPGVCLPEALAATAASLRVRGTVFQCGSNFQRTHHMIGYVILGTNDVARARSFYDSLLAEMGVTRMMEFGARGSAWAAAMDKPMLCIMTPYDGKPATVGNGVMAGIAVESRATVDRMHKKALELGGTDEGAPGLRGEGGEGFYAAYFRDLDGNKLDVYCYG
jgi:catechol 2,3-dioxygenase-like lactoylglutathione lyase family enzyme